MLYIIVGILFFGLLIAVHEWGHFITAKKLDVQVNEFSIGMGPALWSRQKGETKYSLRAFPIGGYCAMEGEDEDTEGNPRSFAAKPLWRKLIILVAGSFMNLLAGFIIMAILFSIAGSYSVPVIRETMDGCPAEGILLPGDRILNIDGHRVTVFFDLSPALSAGGDEKTIVVRRDGQKLTLKDVPLPLKEYTDNGKTLKLYGLRFQREEPAFPGVLAQSWRTCDYFARLVWDSLGMMIRGQVGLSDISGPVGIVSTLEQVGSQGETVSAGMQNVLFVIALIAVNLAVMNMLPIPGLDGGRVFLLIAGELFYLVTRRRLDPKYEGYLNAGFLVLILGFMAVVTFSDVWKLIK